MDDSRQEAWAGIAYFVDRSAHRRHYNLEVMSPFTALLRDASVEIIREMKALFGSMSEDSDDEDISGSNSDATFLWEQR